jgi:hypothetical protein
MSPEVQRRMSNVKAKVMPTVRYETGSLSGLVQNYLEDIMTYMPIARQRLGKHIPDVTLSTLKGHLLLGIGQSTRILDKRRRCLPWGPCLRIIRGYSQKNLRLQGVQRSTKEYQGVQRSSVQL